MSLDNIDDAYPLTPVQKGMLYHVLQSGGSDVYVSYLSLAIQGFLDVARFKQAWQSVYQHHEALRSGFVWEGLDEPLQLVHTDFEIPWRLCQWDEKTGPEHQRKLACLIKAERSRPFDLGQAPLTRMVLVQHDDQHHSLLWVIHHLLADGWSTPVILRDLMRAYDQPKSSPNGGTGMRFSSFVAWSATRDQNAARRFWQQMLGQAKPSPLKLARPGLGLSADVDRQVIPERRVKLSTAQTDQLMRFAQSTRLTLGTLVHGAWALLLSEVCDTSEPLFGSTTSGRAAGLPGMDEAVGMFLNTLPICVSITENDRLVSWLSQLQSQLQSIARHEALPLSDIQRLVLRSEGEPLFESIVVIEGHSSDLTFAANDGSLILHDLRYATHSHYPLALLAFPGARLELAVVYEPSRFLSADIDRLLARFECVLCGLEDMADLPLAGWSDAIPAIESQATFNTGQSVPELAYTRIEHWFDEQVRRSPDAVAVSAGDESLTYRVLDARITRHQALIQQACTPMPAVIGLMVPRSVDMIAAMFAILRAGAAYLPIDPDYPSTRITQVLKSAEITMVCALAAQQEQLTNLGATVIAIDSEISPAKQTMALAPTVPSDVAYVIYTSGSTGESKGVPITHQQLLYSTAARVSYYGQTKPRFLLVSSVSFDSSVVGIFWTLCTGGHLVLPKPGEEREIEALTVLVKAKNVSHTLMLPSLYSLLLQYGDSPSLASLSCVIVAGEACPPTLAKQHFEAVGQARLFNEYGPTEACVWSSVHEISKTDDALVPIGKPIGTTQLLVLNRLDQLCPIGVEGEIVIGGPGVASGYYNDDALTRIRFFESPDATADFPVLYRTGDLGYWRDDGCLMFTGRKDRQVKIRGHRVEPGEIEAVFQSYPGIEEALVTTRTIGETTLSAQLLEIPADEAEALLAEIESLSDAQIQANLSMDDS